MKLQLKLKQKIQILIISIATIIYLFAIGYISINARQTTTEDTERIVDINAQKFAKQIQVNMNESMAVVRTLARGFENYDSWEKDKWQDLINQMYDKIIREHHNIYSLWDSWELNVIDTSWNKPYGRITNTYFREQGIIKNTNKIRSQEGDNEIYSNIKEANREMILPLYFDVFTEGKSEKRLMSSLLCPIQKDNGDYVGIVGVDVTMDRFQELINNIDLQNLQGDYAFLISHKGKYAGHPDTSKLNKAIEKNPTQKKGFDLYKKLKEDEPFSIIHKNNELDKQYVSYCPIDIGRTGTPWYLGISIPVSSIMHEADKNFVISLIIGVIGLILLFIVIYIITKNITNPVEKLTSVLNRLSEGQIDEKMKLNVNTGDEIEEMANALNTSIEELNKKNEFANKLGNGELDIEYELSGNKDELGKSLLEMRNSLKKNREAEEKRKTEEEKRQWTNEGLNKFADIQRQNNENIQNLADEVIKNLVFYLEANQGGIFLVNDEDENNKFLELKSAFAFDRKKFFERKIEFGDGLVGTCALEKQTIYMTEIPQDYIEITSGLGDANPDCLLLVPVKTEDQLVGVVEIASFNKLEDYQISFVEKVCESIASTISSVKVNMKTQKLLEQSQQQSEELSSQEEEMRQNMEELQATQEEAARQKADMESVVNAFHKANYVVEYDLDEKIVDVNDKYLELLGLTKEEVVGTHHTYKMKLTEKQKKDYKKFWDELREGKVKKDTNVIELNGKTFIFAETYTPIIDENGAVKKILKIAIEISEFDFEKISST